MINLRDQGLGRQAARDHMFRRINLHHNSRATAIGQSRATYELRVHVARGSLTLAEAPLIDGEMLLRRPGPAHLTRS